MKRMVISMHTLNAQPMPTENQAVAGAVAENSAVRVAALRTSTYAGGRG